MIRVALCASAMFLGLGPARAAEVCPVASLGIAEIAQAIRAAPTCRSAFAVMQSCRFNTGNDVELAGIVTERCEATFRSRLSSAQRQAYHRTREACARRYAGRQGTIYASFHATCEAAAAVRWAGSR